MSPKTPVSTSGTWLERDERSVSAVRRKDSENVLGVVDLES
jgi:hypothetical protein